MDVFKKLMSTLSVSGREHALTVVIEEMLKDHVDSITRDNMGNLIAFKKGTAPNAKKLMLAGHMDEIGFIVTHIQDNGYIRINSIGGIRTESYLMSPKEINFCVPPLILLITASSK